MNKTLIPVLFSILVLGIFGFSQNVFADTPVSSCLALTIPGETYYLTNNISSGSTCIEINAPGIIFDGMGYTILGPGLYPLPTPLSPAKIGVDVNADGVTVKNTRITNYHLGINLQFTKNNFIINNNINNALFGIAGSNSEGNHYEKNTVRNSQDGLHIGGAHTNNNVILYNDFSYNTRYGMYILDSSNNVVTDNKVNHNDAGSARFVRSDNNRINDNTFDSNKIELALDHSDNNLIYHNYFLNNVSPISLASNTNLQFDLPYPTGGNHWSRYDEPSEGCYDNNADGFCDAPFILSGAQDNMPFCRVCQPSLPSSPTELIDFVEDLGVNSNAQNNLVAPLKQAQELLDDDNPNNDSAVCNKLDAFMNQVDAQEGRKLSPSEADELRSAGQHVLDALHCS